MLIRIGEEIVRWCGPSIYVAERRWRKSTNTNSIARGRRWVQSTISSIRIGFNSSFSLKLCHNTLPSFVLTAKFEKFIYLFSNLCGKIIVIKSPISGLSRKKKKSPLEVQNCGNKDEANIKYINSNAFKISKHWLSKTNYKYPKTKPKSHTKLIESRYSQKFLVRGETKSNQNLM